MTPAADNKRKYRYGSMRELAAHAAENYPDTRFFICGDGQLPYITGKRLYGICGKAAGYLSFLPPHSRVALLGPGSAAWITVYFAVISAGHVAVPLHDGMQQQELEDCIRQAECAMLIYDGRRSEAAERIKERMPEAGVTELHAFLDELDASEDLSYPDLPPDDPAAMYFTSGTTGRPRCAVLTNRNMGSQISAVTEVLPLSRSDVGLSVLPLSHTFEMMTNIAGALHCGGTLYLNESVRTVKKNLREKRPTILVAVPLVLQTLRKEIIRTARKQGEEKKLENAIRLSRTMQKFNVDISEKLFREVHGMLGGRLHTVICGGASLDPELIAFFRALGIEILQGYGITECSPVVTANSPAHDRIGSLGRCLPCCEVRVADGEICVRGDSVSPGYFRDDMANEQSFRDGWFRTGDLGYMDDDGYLYFTGRLKNLIILPNGENVSPEELEERLYREEGVLDAVVYEKDGRITAELHVDRDIIPDTAAAWKKVGLVNRRLASFKQIGAIVLRDRGFEKTVTNKIKRYTVERS